MLYNKSQLKPEMHHKEAHTVIIICFMLFWIVFKMFLFLKGSEYVSFRCGGIGSGVFVWVGGSCLLMSNTIFSTDNCETIWQQCRGNVTCEDPVSLQACQHISCDHPGLILCHMLMSCGNIALNLLLPFCPLYWPASYKHAQTSNFKVI